MPFKGRNMGPAGVSSPEGLKKTRVAVIEGPMTEANESAEPRPRTDDSVAFFRKSWSVYDALVEWNYMFHREIYSAVTAWLRERRDLSAGSLLDLGCGNGRILARSFEIAPPARYAGVDLSAEALAEAREYLGGLSDVELFQADMLSFLENGSNGAFDVIFSGFALHHLGSEEKRRLFREAARGLAPGGAFLLIDVVRDDLESRDEAVAAYIRDMRRGWTRMTATDLENACAHVAEFDFPESVNGLVKMATEAGLVRHQRLASYGRHEAVVFFAPDSDETGSDRRPNRV
jgi:SAM-dependent methyltransferase